MSVWLVPDKVRVERMNICKSCKFYVEKTHSCGPLVFGKKVENDIDPKDIPSGTHYRKKIKLCGCVVVPLTNMKLCKTSWATARCPAGKWSTYKITPEMAKQIREFILPLRGKDQITADQLKTLYQFRNAVTGIKEQISQCPSCITDMINDMWNAVKSEV